MNIVSCALSTYVTVIAPIETLVPVNMTVNEKNRINHVLTIFKLYSEEKSN